MSGRGPIASVLVTLAALSAPALATTFTVLNANPTGADSLRAAITAANADATATAASPHVITFNIPGTGPFTIALTAASGALPGITRPTTIDAAGEKIPGAAGSPDTPGVRLDGSALGGTGYGFVVGANADSSTINYFSITGFGGTGVLINTGASDVVVTHCYIGLAADGATVAANAGGMAVFGPNAVIGHTLLDGNVISGNTSYGVLLNAGADGSGLHGNYIGTSASGTVAKGNGGAGIYGNGATGVTVGGTTFIIPTANVIAGNGSAGVTMSSSSSGWTILGNNIGVDASGATAMGNSGGGIDADGDNTIIGSTSASGANIISGNNGTGIVIDVDSTGTAIYGNKIGTNGVGTGSVGSAQSIGIRVFGKNCTIGGTSASYRNVIAGNSNDGISLEGNSSSCVVTGNWIGVDATGNAALPNAGGIALDGTLHRVGGTTAGERNVISGNTSVGIALYGVFDQIQGNYIGTSAGGAMAVGNGGSGIRAITSSYDTIGGPTAAHGNVISGNAGPGIALDSDTGTIEITSNLIGVNAANTAPIPNAGGISVGGSGHVIGAAGQGNVISGNTQTGIAVSGTGHAIKGNYIGTNALNNAAIGNASAGVRLLVTSGVTIGGTGTGEGNVISRNYNGISLDATSSNCTVIGNLIGTNVTGTAALGNLQTGITVDGTGHVIGGSVAGTRNLISGNPAGGIVLSGANHQVLGNLIGLDATGTAAIANGSYGIRGYTVSGTMIGGLTAASGNVISGNSRGVSFEYGSHDNTMLNNIVGLNATATADLPDNGSCIEIGSGSHDNHIGTAGAGNVLAGSSYHGIVLSGADSTGNTIQGNFIGTNKSLASGLGNYQLGIYIISNGTGTKIGGAGQGNVIAYNGYIGIWVSSGERNEIAQNSIFANGYLGIDVGEQGVQQNDGGDGDDGGNHSQNYPLLSSVTVGGGATQVEGLLLNEPGTQYRVELFSSPTCDGTGFGEGKTYLGSTQITTDASGHAALVATLPLAVADPFVSATVTDPLGNTSEFSPCAEVGGPNPGEVQFVRQSTLAYEGTLPTGDVVITRSKGLSGTITVQFDIEDDTADAGSDYVDSDQVVTFAPWEVVKTIKVPIILDPAPESDPEKADLHLTSPSGGATLGLADAAMLIFDYDPAYPGASIDDAEIVEGDAGQKMLTFAVHMSPSDHDVTIAYLTEDGTAVQGEDYEYADGEVFFPVGTDVQYVQVPIDGDSDIEGDETFTLRLTVAPSGGVWVAFDALATGTILEDDDPAGGSPLMIDGFETGSTVVWSATQTP